MTTIMLVQASVAFFVDERGLTSHDFLHTSMCRFVVHGQFRAVCLRQVFFSLLVVCHEAEYTISTRTKDTYQVDPDHHQNIDPSLELPYPTA